MNRPPRDPPRYHPRAEGAQRLLPVDLPVGISPSRSIAHRSRQSMEHGQLDLSSLAASVATRTSVLRAAIPSSQKVIKLILSISLAEPGLRLA